MSKEESLESKLEDLKRQLEKWKAVNPFDQQEREAQEKNVISITSDIDKVQSLIMTQK